MADPQDLDFPYPKIGQLALKYKLIAKESLDLAWKTCHKAEKPTLAFADYLVKHKLISSLDMKRLFTASRVMAIRKKDVKFGTIAVEQGYLSTSLLKLALDEQKRELTRNKRSILLGEILVEAGMITKHQCSEILKEQNRLKELNRAIIDPVDSSDKSQKEPDPLPLESSHKINIERGMALTIEQDGIAAFISKTQAFDKTITVDEIKDILRQQGVIFGIVDKTLIKGFIKSNGFDKKPFRVALGIKPKSGTDAVVKYYFPTNRLRVGKISENGTMDFKERGKIPRVACNDILAEKIPAVEGVYGKNVFGETIAITPAQDIKLRYEKGAALSTDGLKIIAKIDGEPNISWTGSISVLDEFVADTVDYETGHINYHGNIRIKGCVRNGFKINGENVRVGEIDGGTIHANGDLSVAGGINEAVIHARGNIWAKFIHKSTIHCMGDIYTTREIVESNLETSGACVINQGKLIASTVSAKMGIFAKNVGTDRSAPSVLKVGEDFFMVKEIEELKKNMAQDRQQLADAKKKKSTLEIELKAEQKKISRLAHVQETSIANQKKTKTSIAALNPARNQQELTDLKASLEALKHDAVTAEEALAKSFETVEQKTKELKELLNGISTLKQRLIDLDLEQKNLKDWAGKNPGVALVNVTQTLETGTKIMGCHSEFKVKKSLKKVKIREFFSTIPGENQDKGWWEMKIIPD